MLMNREQSVLLIVDVQAKLAPFIHDGEQVAAHCAWLAQVAERVGVPVVVTEHFPEKIGGTLDSVRAATQAAHYVGKQCFSAQDDGCLDGTAVERQRQWQVPCQQRGRRGDGRRRSCRGAEEAAAA